MKYIVNLNGKDYEVVVEKGEATLVNVTNSAAAPAAIPASAPAAVSVPAPSNTAVADGSPVLAPLNGTVLNVNVKVGDTVKAGDVVLIIEAMKMENEIVAPSDGTISQIAVTKGSSVNTDDLLVVLS